MVDRASDTPTLVAYLVSSDEAVRPDPASLRRALSTMLLPQMIPARFHYLETLPRTPNGKLDRRALPRPEPEALGRVVDPNAARHADGTDAGAGLAVGAGTGRHRHPRQFLRSGRRQLARGGAHPGAGGKGRGPVAGPFLHVADHRRARATVRRDGSRRQFIGRVAADPRRRRRSAAVLHPSGLGRGLELCDARAASSARSAGLRAPGYQPAAGRGCAELHRRAGRGLSAADPRRSAAWPLSPDRLVDGRADRARTRGPPARGRRSRGAAGAARTPTPSSALWRRPRRWRRPS